MLLMSVVQRVCWASEDESEWELIVDRRRL